MGFLGRNIRTRGLKRVLRDDASVAERGELLLKNFYIKWVTAAGRLVRLGYSQEPTAGQAESAGGD